MSERTTAKIGSNLFSGEACSNCGVTYAKCTEKLLGSVGVGSTCCGLCRQTDTHAVQSVREHSDDPPTPSIHIAIGNSDDKLTQAQWADYVTSVDVAVRRAASVVHGYWHSMPDAPWQNAAWSFQVSAESSRVMLRLSLAALAKRFRQDSVAWNESVTEFLGHDTDDIDLSPRMLGSSLETPRQR